MQAFGNSFKWLLFGDEDTVFFVDNVLELLQDFDPSMPYIITGAVLPVAQECPRVLVRVKMYAALPAGQGLACHAEPPLMHSAAEAAAPSEHVAPPLTIHALCPNHMSASPGTLPEWQPCQ